MALPKAEVQEGQTRYIVYRARDYINDRVHWTGGFEQDLLPKSRELLTGIKSGYVLDIGANMGTWTLPLAQEFGHLDFLCFEPQEPVYYQLCGNIALNSLLNVRAFNLALGRESATMEIDLPDYAVEKNVGGFSLDPLVKANDPTTQSGNKRLIDIATLDSLDLSSVVLIKMDVEGFELDVIKGALDTLARNGYPPILFESWTQFEWWKERGTELFAYIESLGYTITSPCYNNFLAQK